jgi:hypothetical protein
MAPDTPQRLSGHAIRAAHHNQLAPQYLLSQIIIAQRESSNKYIQMCYKHDVSLCTYRKERANTSIKTATHIRVGVETKRTSPLQCSPATSRSQGGGNGHRTAKHNQLYLKALNRLTVAGNPEQQGLDDKKTHAEPRHQARRRQARSRQERAVLEGEGEDLMVLEDLCGLGGLAS